MHITLANLALELGVDRSHLRKYVLAKGFLPVRIRTPESKGQLTLALSENDAESVRELRESEGFCGKAATNDEGSFYVVRLVPEALPNRVKCGFASDVAARLQSHRTAAPTAELVEAWPCKRSWEAAAIASATRAECTLVANEVYDCESVETLVMRCEEFFRIMPR